MLVDRGCELVVVPAETPAQDVLGMNPDGIFLSNGLVIQSLVSMLLRQLRNFCKRTSLFLVFVGASVACFGKWRANSENEVWPPWRQPSCAKY